MQHFGDEKEVMLRFQSRGGQDQQALIDTVKTTLATTDYAIEYRKVDYVGPTVGKELIADGALAMGLGYYSYLTLCLVSF